MENRLGSLLVKEMARAISADEHHDDFVQARAEAEIRDFCEDVLGFTPGEIRKPTKSFNFWIIMTDLSVHLVPVFRARKVVGVRLLVPCWDCDAMELMDPVAKDLAGLAVMLDDEELRTGDNLSHAYGLEWSARGRQVYYQIKRRHAKGCSAVSWLDI